jgi:hypothetical protein
VAVEDFKSWRALSLTNVNLIAGPKALGEINVLEAICFFLGTLSREELLEIPRTPHIPYCWSVEGLFLHGLVSSIFRFPG